MSVSVMHLLYSLRRLDGGMGGTLENLWIVGNWFQSGSCLGSVRCTNKSAGWGGCRNKFVAFVRPHLFDSGVPE